MKREIGVILVFLIIVLGSAHAGLCMDEYVLETDELLEEVPEDLGVPEEAEIVEIVVEEEVEHPLLVPVSDINSYLDKNLADKYKDAIYISNAIGEPKSKFWDTENVYLRDNRIDESLDEFFARTHQGYNIETQEFRPKYANLYEPDSLVDIYVVFDQDIYESDLSDFFIPRSTPFGMESRTVNYFGTIVVKKVTVETDSRGKLPLVNLGQIDIREIFRNIDLVGKTRTYDISSEFGNILNSDPMSRLKTPVRFDVFIDANRDMRWSWIGDLYHSNIVGRGWLREEPDVYLNGPVPGFSVRYNPERYSKTCCGCEKAWYEVVNINDVYECNEYCEKINQEGVGWLPRKCSEMGLVMEEPVKKPGPPELEGLTFCTIDISSELEVRSMMESTMGQKEAPTKEVIAFSDQRTMVRNEPLRSKDGQIFEIVPDLMDYNPVNNLLLITTRYGEVYVIEIARGPDNNVFGKQIHYLERIWDPKIAPTGQRPFNSIPTEAVMLDNGRIILKDALGEDYTLIFKSRAEPVVMETDESLTGISFKIQEFADQKDVFVKRLAIEEAGNVKPFTDDTGVVFDFTPKKLDYNSQSNMLGVLTSQGYIYVIKIERNEFGYVVGRVIQEIRDVRERGLQLEGDGTFYGAPTNIDVQNSGDMIIYDNEGKGFKLYTERDIFTDFDIPYDAVLLRGMHFGERPKTVSPEEIEEITEAEVVEEVPPAAVPVIEVEEEGVQGKPSALRDAIFLTLIILIVAVLIIALLIFEFRRTERP